MARQYTEAEPDVGVFFHRMSMLIFHYILALISILITIVSSMLLVICSFMLDLSSMIDLFKNSIYIPYELPSLKTMCLLFTDDARNKLITYLKMSSIDPTIIIKEECDDSDDDLPDLIPLVNNNNHEDSEVEDLTDKTLAELALYKHTIDLSNDTDKECTQIDDDDDSIDHLPID